MMRGMLKLVSRPDHTVNGRSTAVPQECVLALEAVAVSLPRPGYHVCLNADRPVGTLLWSSLPRYLCVVHHNLPRDFSYLSVIVA